VLEEHAGYAHCTSTAAAVAEAVISAGESAEEEDMMGREGQRRGGERRGEGAYTAVESATKEARNAQLQRERR
jgi:hypothetical protein